ncbi:helix-turn-helix domain-containing protein [Hymenobacter rubripertinctus]|uniref:XRE family transcriptional regulator n=1 Tax=Hymenobacter rubripertinctus TaxID=2029981 RepID=A0A418QVW6_9BACT|nr:helix-turn-helix transcriptional regulator [Hymenobacter rubripertinctus]RIY09293.1 XRE family transcriptional regulator [Hymenobacter rubripertinctus]
MATTPSPSGFTTAIRAYFGLSQRQLARYLRVSYGFVTHLEAGRKELPLALVTRLLYLLQQLPPLLGQGVPAPAAPGFYDPLAPLPPPEPGLAGAEQPGPVPPDPDPLRRRLRDTRLRLLVQGQQLALFQRRAAALAHRHQALARLQAAAPPPDPTEAAHYAHWLAGLAADLTCDEPNPAATAAARLLLVARIAGLRAEVATLTAAASA